MLSQEVLFDLVSEVDCHFGATRILYDCIEQDLGAMVDVLSEKPVKAWLELGIVHHKVVVLIECWQFENRVRHGAEIIGQCFHQIFGGKAFDISHAHQKVVVKLNNQMAAASDPRVLVFRDKFLSFLKGTANFLMRIHCWVNVLRRNYFLLMLEVKDHRDKLDTFALLVHFVKFAYYAIFILKVGLSFCSWLPEQYYEIVLWITFTRRFQPVFEYVSLCFARLVVFMLKLADAQVELVHPQLVFGILAVSSSQEELCVLLLLEQSLYELLLDLLWWLSEQDLANFRSRSEKLRISWSF